MKIEKDKFNALSEKDQNLQLLRVSIFISRKSIQLDPSRGSKVYSGHIPFDITEITVAFVSYSFVCSCMLVTV